MATVTSGWCMWVASPRVCHVRVFLTIFSSRDHGDAFHLHCVRRAYRAGPKAA